MRLSSRSECGQSNRRKSREAVITQAPWLQSERKSEAKREDKGTEKTGEIMEKRWRGKKLVEKQKKRATF